MAEHEEGDRVEAIERHGLPRTISGIVLRPKAFFESFPDLPTRIRPLPLFMLIHAVVWAEAAGLGELGAGGSTLGRMIAWALVGGLFAVPNLYVSAFCVHLFVRLFRGRERSEATRAVFAYASVPLVFGFLPYAGLALIPWFWALATLGLARVHGLSLVRAFLSVIGPLILAVLFALGVRKIVIEAFRIPSAGMSPTLLVGDHVFVAKSAYGLIARSFPERGDLIVFQYPDPDPSHAPMDFVERAIALPGDVLEMEEGHVVINGWRVPSCNLGWGHLPGNGGEERSARFSVEFLSGRSYLVAFTDPGPPARRGPFTVPDGHVYVLGDNRNNSSDSRAWNQGKGAGVPLGHIKGRAIVVWFPPARVGISLRSDPVLPRSAAELTPALVDCLAKTPLFEATIPPKPRH